MLRTTIKTVLDRQPVLEDPIALQDMTLKRWGRVLFNKPNIATIIITLILIGMYQYLSQAELQHETLTQVIQYIDEYGMMFFPFVGTYLLFNSMMTYSHFTTKFSVDYVQYIEDEKQWRKTYVEPYFEKRPFEKVPPARIEVVDSDFSRSGLLAKVDYSVKGTPKQDIVAVKTDPDTDDNYVAITTIEEDIVVGKAEYKKGEQRAVLLYVPKGFVEKYKTKQKGNDTHDSIKTI